MSRLSPAVPGEKGRTQIRGIAFARETGHGPERGDGASTERSAAPELCPNLAYSATEQLLNTWQLYSSFVVFGFCEPD